MRPAILIHGPTASGKTELSIRLAQALDGEIVNADSMQVYADLRVLTARPDDSELARARHHLFGHVDGARRYNTGQWLSDAGACIADIRARGRTPIVAGGTGLYLAALVKGLSHIPPIGDLARRRAREAVEADPGAAHAMLQEADAAAAARIPPGDRQRVARALEVWFETGRPLSVFQTPAAAVLGTGEWLGIALTPPRDALYARIDRRFDGMIGAGAPEEARRLHARGLARDLPVMRAHGMPGFCDYFDGLCSLEDAVARAKRDTRRYAKRQFTWVAHQFPTWPRIPGEDVEKRIGVVSALYDEIDGNRAKGYWA